MALKTDYILDETDHLILELLQRNARLTMRELGEKVNMSAQGVSERVKRLEERGIITGYHASICLDKLDKKVHGYILVANLPYQKLDEFYRLIRETPELYCAETVVSGGQEAMLKVACSDTNRLMEISRSFYPFCTATTAHLVAEPPAKDEPIPTR